MLVQIAWAPAYIIEIGTGEGALGHVIIWTIKMPTIYMLLSGCPLQIATTHRETRHEIWHHSAY